MKLIKLNKIKDGKFIKNYELTYENKAGRPKTYEIISHNNLNNPEDIGKKCSGVAIIALDKSHEHMVLLKEFRLGVNKVVCNLCAGRLEDGESIEECARRELKEETGLDLIKILKIFPPSFAAVAITDIKNQMIIAEVDGSLSTDYSSDNEEIVPLLINKDEAANLLDNHEFASRAQLATYMFSVGAFDK